MMTDYTNKKVNFLHSKISVKINKQTYFNGQSKIYLCSDLYNSSITYCLKIAKARNDDKAACNSISTEILIMLSMKEKQNIVQIIDYYSQDAQNVTTYFILMEYCGNGSLADTMTRLSNDKNSFSEPQIWRIMCQLCQGLISIHRNKTAHRDIKPENILITLDGVYKISDFGSSTNKFYETSINNNIRNEIIFDISRNTTPAFRAPEQLDLYTGYPINEKVDIWALGLILYSLLFDSQLFNTGAYTDNYSAMNSTSCQRIVKGNIVLTEEMTGLYSSSIIELLKIMMKPNPLERISASETLTFIEKNKDKLRKVEMSQSGLNIINKRAFSITKMVSDATAKLFKRHSTQFWIIKLMNCELSSIPKFKYIKLLVNKAWTKKNKINKFFMAISTRPTHFFSFLALKSLYIFHHYIFLGPPETARPNNFNLEEYLQFFSALWQTRYSTDNYDKSEVLKNAYVTKFIISYADYLKVKFAYHKKYPHIDNNFSIENLCAKKDFDFSLLVDKKFIADTISIYSLLYQKFIQVPIIVNQIANTLDAIIQVINEELISLFRFIFYVIIAFKNYNSKKLINSSQISISSNNENFTHLKVFDSQFLEITSKAKEYVERYKKFRAEIKSNRSSINFPIVNCNNSNSNILIEYLNSLDNNLKFFPNTEFDLYSFFLTPKEIVGVKLNRNIGKLIQANLFLEDIKKASKKDNQDDGAIIIDQSKSRNSMNIGNKNSSMSMYPDKFPKSFTIDKKSDVNHFSHRENNDFSPEKFSQPIKKFDFDLAYKKETQLKVSVINKEPSRVKISDNNINRAGRASLQDINEANQTNFGRNYERGRSLDTFEKNNTQSLNSNVPKLGENKAMPRNSNNSNHAHAPSKIISEGNVQNNQNFNQSLFNNNFFSKSNNIIDNYGTENSAANNKNNKSNIQNPNVGVNHSNTNNYNSNFDVIDSHRNSNEKEEITSTKMVNSILNDIFESNKGCYGSNVMIGNNNNNNNNRQNNQRLIDNNHMVVGAEVKVVRNPQSSNIIHNNNNNNVQNITTSNKVFPHNPQSINNQTSNSHSQRYFDNQTNLNNNPNFQNNVYNNPYAANNGNYFYNGNMNPNYNNDYYETNISNRHIQNINTNYFPQGMIQGNNTGNYRNSDPSIENSNYRNSDPLMGNSNYNMIPNQNIFVPKQAATMAQPFKLIDNKKILTNQNVNGNYSGINNSSIPVNKQPINYLNENIAINNSNLNKNINENNNSKFHDINQSEDDLNYESVKSDFNSVNIINIQNNFNNIKVLNEEANIEDLANEFLKEELRRSNLQWLIASKDIKYDKQIGFGGSSEVFKADYRGTDVAVKKLRILEVKEENLKEFKREVSSLILLRHPYLVLFMGAIAEKDNICIVTEYCVGGTLFNLLHQLKELVITWELRLRILYEMAVGMNFLHTNSPPIIHRDLKSLNILLTEKIERPTDNTKVKISDFGLSKIMKTFDSTKEQMTGQLGTCHWMAPEVIENKNYSLKADVYSYGIIIWEILTRRTPYHDMRQEQISFYVTVKKGRPDKSLIAPNAPPAFVKLMEMCWDAEPNNRPSFEQIIDYLKKLKL